MAFWIFSAVKYLSINSLAHFSVELSVFFLLIFGRSDYILDAILL